MKLEKKSVELPITLLTTGSLCISRFPLCILQYLSRYIWRKQDL